MFTSETKKLPGRNQLCPCGSGKKYKRCHGAQPVATPSSLPVFPVSIHAIQQLRMLQHRQQEFNRNHGQIKEVISTEVNGWRFVAVGSTLHYGQNWRSFDDFLRNYLRLSLGSEWVEKQIKLPVHEQHPIVQWHTYLGSSSDASKPNDLGFYVSANGAARAWGRLAYDLYLIQHNAELQKRLIKRLRDRHAFQGARFETAVAAMMLAAGYELRFSDEKGPGKHPEFYATHKDTGTTLAVEAKSRHRPGILGFQSNSKPECPEKYGIDGLLKEAIEKDTKLPLLVFIEVNSPTYLPTVNPQSMISELEASWESVQRLEWSNGFPCIGVVFYNDVAPWFLQDPLKKDEVPSWATTYWPDHSRHKIDVKPLLRRILEGGLQRSNVPHDFPSS